MVMLSDLLERRRALEEENARIQRDLGILRQIDELAAQLGEPVTDLPATPYAETRRAEEEEAERRRAEEEAESERAFAAEQEEKRRAAETAKALEMAQQAFGPGEPEPEPAKAKAKRSVGEVKKVLDALEHFRGEALQVDLVRKAGMTSGQVSSVCQQLEDDGKIKCVGYGGYQNKSKRWRLAEKGSSPVSPRVRRAMERDAKKKGPTQPPTHEGRILNLLTVHNSMTVPEMAAELSIPASTVGRLVGKLKEEGEVTDIDDRGHFRRVMT